MDTSLNKYNYLQVGEKKSNCL